MNVAIFASGSGTNAVRIIEYFAENQLKGDFTVFVNKPNAGVIAKAQKLEVPVVEFTLKDSKEGVLLENLKKQKIDFIVLAGYLWRVASDVVADFPEKIINIHPSLLPKYGGKGMYGANVHRAVIANKEVESGITIHYVNDIYDDGEVILQAKCEVKEGDDADSLYARIQKLEHYHYPRIVASLVTED